MTCPSTEELLDFADGWLDESTSARVVSHLADCPRCRHRGAAFREPEVRTGQRLGRYVLMQRIGSGAAGVVYEAADPVLGRKVAVKLLRADLHTGAHAGELQARLLREAQALARLAHPNVVSIYDVGSTAHGVFIAMERIDGVTIASWLASGARSWLEVLDAYLEAGRGLAAAHAGGVVHRDFKPENVLIGPNGRVCVTDFGVARVVAAPMSRRGGFWESTEASALDEPLTQSGAVLGSPRYMAPEQMAGEPADVRSDIFSFSVALWAGLYGTLPFAGLTFRSLRDAVLEGRVELPPAETSVPAGVREALLRGLRFAPAERPQQMKELLSALEGERIAEALARAEQVLKEAEGFFRPSEKTRAVSILAVSLLQGALGGGSAPPAIGRSDLPLLGEVEILGARLVALMAALQPYRRLVSFVLAREGLPVAADGTLGLDPDAWYPFAAIVHFAHRGAATFGRGAAFDLAQVWAHVTLENNPDVRALPLAQAIVELGDRLARDNRVHGSRLDTSPLRRQAIGLWTCVLRDGGELEICSSDPFVCATDLGFFTQVLHELGAPATLTHDGGPCRDVGATECRYVVSSISSR